MQLLLVASYSGSVLTFTSDLLPRNVCFPTGQRLRLRQSTHFGLTGRHICWPNPTSKWFTSAHRSLQHAKTILCKCNSKFPEISQRQTNASSVRPAYLPAVYQIKHARARLFCQFQGGGQVEEIVWWKFGILYPTISVVCMICHYFKNQCV